MEPFQFTPIQSLQILREDRPKIEVIDGTLLITAERNGERIMITAPLSDTVPYVHKTNVKIVSGERKLAVRKPVAISPTARLCGEDHPRSKLTEEQVREIKRICSDEDLVKTFTNKYQMCLEMGKIYKVHLTTIANIINQRSWKHLV